MAFRHKFEDRGYDDELAHLTYFTSDHSMTYLFDIVFSHIRSLGAAGALAIDICICFHDTES